MELITGDGRVVQLAEVADLIDDAADFVVVFDRRTQSVVGDVDTEVVVERLQDLLAALGDIESQTVVVCLHRDFEILIVEAFLRHGIEQFHVLDAAVDHGASVGSDEGIEALEAAFNGALEDGSRELAEETGHVIGRHIHGTGARGPEPDGERARKVHQDFRSLEANVTDAFAAVFGCLTNEFVVDIVQETFQGEQVFEILHKYLLIKYLTW